MSRIPLSEGAKRLLSSNGIDHEDIAWRPPPGVTVGIATLAERNDAATPQPAALLYLAHSSERLPKDLDEAPFPVDVVWAPFTAVELEDRLARLFRRSRLWVRWIAAHSTSEVDERLSVVGRVAASIAHEMGNALSYTCTNIEYVRDAIRGGHTDDPELDLVATESAEGVRRALDACRAVLHLSAGTSLEPSPVDVNEAVERALRLLRTAVPEGTRLEAEFGSVPQALGDPGGLLQVLTNLVLNASQAVRSGARILIRTEVLKERVLVSVSDNGPGIPPSLVPFLFEPFKTGRPGRGTGLGLTISKQLVESYGGTVDVAQGPMGGPIFDSC